MFYRCIDLVYICLDRLEYGIKNFLKCIVIKFKEIKENELEGIFGKKKDSRKVEEFKYYYVFIIGLIYYLVLRSFFEVLEKRKYIFNVYIFVNMLINMVFFLEIR